MNKLKLKQIIELVDIQARMRMRAQANKLFLSYLWWVLEPMMFVAMFYFVFEYMLQRGGENYLVFLMVGKIAFMWISKGMTMGSNSLIQNKGIIGQRALPKWIFPLVNVQEATYKAFFAYVVLLVLLVLSGTSNPAFWWQLIPVMLVTYLFISGMAFIFSILVAIAEDFGQLISLFMMGLMFGSGVFWDINKLSNERMADLILTFNPVAAILDINRLILINNQIIDFKLLIAPLVISILLWVVSLMLFKKLNNQVTRLLFS